MEEQLEDIRSDLQNLAMRKKNTANEKLMILEKVVRAIQKYEDTARGKLVSNDKTKSSELEKQ